MAKKLVSKNLLLEKENTDKTVDAGPSISGPTTPKKARNANNTEYHGYVLKVGAINRSPAKVQYYNAVFHDGAAETNVVGYKTSLYNTLQQACAKSKPVKVTNLLSKFDEFRNEFTFTLNDYTNCEYSNQKIPYSAVQARLKTINAFTSLLDVYEKADIDQNVNVEAYTLITSGTQEINTQYGIKKKMEVQLSDDTSSMKLAVWGNHTNSIPTNGNYKFKDLRVRSFNGKYLTTTALSVIESSSKQFKEITAPSKMSKTISFPPIAVDQLEECYFCVKCQRKAIPNGDLLVCGSCGSKSLKMADGKRYQTKLTFQTGTSNVQLAIPHAVMMSILPLLNKTSEDDITSIEVGLLTAKNITVHYEDNNIVTCIS